MLPLIGRKNHVMQMTPPNFNLILIAKKYYINNHAIFFQILHVKSVDFEETRSFNTKKKKN